eukprot:scaffold98880_cov33-Tisochrysis_lutea.AAC.2
MAILAPSRSASVSALSDSVSVSRSHPRAARATSADDSKSSSNWRATTQAHTMRHIVGLRLAWNGTEQLVVALGWPSVWGRLIGNEPRPMRLGSAHPRRQRVALPAGGACERRWTRPRTSRRRPQPD